GKMDTADKRVQPLLDAVAALAKAHAGFTVAEFGMASATHELNETISKDFQNAEKLSVPVTFVILLLAFGAFVAAGVPVLLAFSAVLGASARNGPPGTRGMRGCSAPRPLGAGGLDLRFHGFDRD